MILGKRYKKYKWGDNIDMDQLSSGAGAVGTMLGTTIDTFSNPNKFGYNKAAPVSGAVKGLGSGIAAGAAFGAPGAIIGGAIGLASGIAGGIKANKAAKEAEEEYKLGLQQFGMAQNNARLATYDTTGSNNNLVYAKLGGKIGGAIPINRYLTYGGEFTGLSKNNLEVEGNSHAEGGVKLPEAGIELEGNETINYSDGEHFAFSDALGFADRHKKIAKQMGKVEKRPYNAISANTLKLLKNKEEALKVEQEQTKAMLGLGTPINNYLQ
jgi:hypothetical protein